jgi:hypothetical protein
VRLRAAVIEGRVMRIQKDHHQDAKKTTDRVKQSAP